jgi:hypothetical protein
MATDHNMHANYQSNPEVSYEHRDLGARNILLFFAILFISGVIIHFIVWGVYGAMERVVARMEPQPNPIKPYEETPRAVILQNTPMVNLNSFAEPRLQDDEPADMRTFNEYENLVLNGKAWVDDKGTVHLPIDVAMEEIVKRGLPVRSAGGNVGGAPVKSLSGAPIENAPETTTRAPAVKP